MPQKLFGVFGSLLLLFALIPLVGYGIFHLGVLAMMVVGAVLVLAAHFWPRMARRPRAAFAALLSLGALYALGLSVWMGMAAWSNPPPAGEPVAVVVLGAKINGDQPSLMLRHRLTAALRYLNAHPDAICVVSGGQGEDELFPEAQVMADWLTGRGVDPERILIEDRSTNTRENLAFSAELLEASGNDGRTIAVATDSFHQLRASLFGRTAGLECRAVSSVSPWGLFPAYWVRELLAVPVALLQAG